MAKRSKIPSNAARLGGSGGHDAAVRSIKRKTPILMEFGGLGGGFGGSGQVWVVGTTRGPHVGRTETPTSISA